MDFDFETYQNSSELDFFENPIIQNPELGLRETPIFKASTFQTSWLGFRGPNSSARGSLSTFRKNLKIEAKPEFDDFLSEESSMEREIFELKKKNNMLKEEKEKLISELINIRIKEIQKNGISFVEETPENFNEDYSKNFSELFKTFQSQVSEYEKKVEKLENENEKYMERMFELEMEKQRLKIKLHQSLQQCENLKDANHNLKNDLEEVYKENNILQEKLKELEKTIEKIEDGDFEHVEKTDDLMNGVIELDTVEAEKPTEQDTTEAEKSDMEVPVNENH